MEEVYFRTYDALYNYGIFFKPEGKDRFPAVVIVHGGLGGAYQRKEQAVAMGSRVREALLKEGYAAFVIDYRRHDFGGLEVEDVFSAFEYLSSRPDVIADKIAFIGGSHGGYITMRVVMRVQAAAAVVYAGLIDLEEAFLRRQRDFSRDTAASEIFLELKEKYGSEAGVYRELSIYTHAEKIKSPILYVVGTEDPLYKQLPTLKEAMERAGKTLEISVHPGMPHRFYWAPKDIIETIPDAENQFQKSLSKTLKFLRDHLKT